MGTHSYIIMRVKVGDEWVTYCKLYQQCDGYLDGVGLNLATFLYEMRLTNGFAKVDRKNLANGAECLFAQIVARFKKEPGYTYLTNPNSPDLEEYNYFVDVDDSSQTILLTIHSSKNLFSGSPDKAVEFIKNYK
jgi:hypothetical protein